MPKRKTVSQKTKKEEQKPDTKQEKLASQEIQSSPGETTRILSAVGYVWILFLIPLLLKKDDFAQFHARQGLMLFICSFIIMILSVIPVLGWIISFIGWIIIIVFSVMGIVKSLQGEKWPMPYLGRFAKKINV